MNIQPIGRRVLVERNEFSYEGAIEIPDPYQDKSQTAVVTAVSPFITEDIKVGDTIVFTKWGEVTGDIGDTCHSFIHEDDIYCVLEEL